MCKNLRNNYECYLSLHYGYNFVKELYNYEKYIMLNLSGV